MKLFTDKTILAGFSDAGDGDLSFYNMADDRVKTIWNALPTVGQHRLSLPTYAHQVHQDRVIAVSEDTPYLLTEKADGLITNLSDRLIGVFSADCLPVIIYSEKAVAAVHAGWRSTCLNIGQRAIEQFSTQYGLPAASLQALIGPCIGQCCLEMGDEVYQQFVDADPVWARFFVKKGKWHLDLRGLNRWQLQHAGIPDSQITDHDDCTFCKVGDYFSFRRQRQRNGSMFSFVVRRGK